MRKGAALAALAGLYFWRGRTRTTGPRGVIPGEAKKTDTRALEVGATLLQSKSPLAAMNLYLDGFHFYADDMGHQMEAHHYCAQLNEDFHQCVIFDGNRKDSRLIGVEYIVSERLFQGLPEDEKRLWHSHHYEVSSGTLIAAGIPEPIERELMKKVISTYGKTWHTWDTMHHELPFGIPALMMGFTADGQMQPEMLARRDQLFGISSDQRRQSRRPIPVPNPLPGANSWESGRSVQLELAEKEMRGRPASDG
jgi:hypothetical protein